MSQRQIRKMQNINAIHLHEKNCPPEIRDVSDENIFSRHQTLTSPFIQMGKFQSESSSSKQSDDEDNLYLEKILLSWKKTCTLPCQEEEIEKIEEFEEMRREICSSTHVNPSLEITQAASSHASNGALLAFRPERKRRWHGHCHGRNPCFWGMATEPKHKLGKPSSRHYWLLPETMSLHFPSGVHSNESLVCTCSSHPDPRLSFDFNFSSGYLKVRDTLHCLMKKRFEESFLYILRHHPFHLETNLLYSQYLLDHNQIHEAYSFCQRAVHALQCSFHPSFRPYKADPSHALGWPQVLVVSRDESKCQWLVYCTLFLYTRFLIHFRQYERAFEICKLLLLMFPRHHVTLLLVHLEAIFIHFKKEFEFCRFFQYYFSEHISFESGTVVNDVFICLPNFYFSRLAMYLRDFCHVQDFNPRDLENVPLSTICTFSHDISRRQSLSLHVEFLRGLILFPEFLQRFVSFIDVELMSFPEGAHEHFTWKDILNSRIFGSFLEKVLAREKQSYLLFVVKFLLKQQMIRLKSFWTSKKIILYVHNLATCVIKRSHKIPQSENEIHFWTQVDAFQYCWARLLIHFHQKIDTFSFFTYLKTTTKDPHQISPHLPPNFMIKLCTEIHLMKPEFLGLSPKYRPFPFIISSDSNPVWVFLFTIIPHVTVEKQGPKGLGLHKPMCLRYCRAWFVNVLSPLKFIGACWNLLVNFFK